MTELSGVFQKIPKTSFVIAIDGPAGTGKSTAAKRISETLGFVHVDTGAIYRAVAYLCNEKKIFDPTGSTTIAEQAAIEFKRDPSKSQSNRVWADGKDITDKIRTPEISMAASKVSAIPVVRAALLGLQRKLGAIVNSVLEGRDIGTVIFPDADVKFFLTANLDERAKRRYLELEAAAKTSGSPVPKLSEIRDQIAVRDEGDSTRAVAPLRKAQDAIEIDTTSMTLDEVVRKMLQISKEVHQRKTKGHT